MRRVSGRADHQCLTAVVVSWSSGTPGGVKPSTWPYTDNSANRAVTRVCAVRNPCCSPGKIS